MSCFWKDRRIRFCQHSRYICLCCCCSRQEKDITVYMMAQLINKAKNFVADKVAHVKKPEADLKDLSLKHMSRGDSVTFDCEVDITNPYRHDLPIGEITYSLKSANRVIASGTIPDPGSITANGTTALDILVKVPYDVLMSIARDVGMEDWDIDYDFEVGLVVHFHSPRRER